MFGITKKFTCKKCGKTTVATIGATAKFNVNASEETYIPVSCSHCGEQYYVTENNNAQNSLVHVSEIVSLKKIGVCFY